MDRELNFRIASRGLLAFLPLLLTPVLAWFGFFSFELGVFGDSLLVPWIVWSAAYATVCVAQWRQGFPTARGIREALFRATVVLLIAVAAFVVFRLASG